jgi:hypothetical protein
MFFYILSTCKAVLQVYYEARFLPSHPNKVARKNIKKPAPAVIFLKKLKLRIEEQDYFSFSVNVKQKILLNKFKPNTEL